MVLTMSILKAWPTKQIDFVMAYTQAEVENDNMFMDIPKGFQVVNAEGAEEYVLQLRKNLYGQKQAGRVWNKHLVGKLKSIGFIQSEVDECVFYRKGCIYVLYTDDSIVTGPREQDLDDIINDMKKAGLDLTVEGDMADFLGVQINRKPDGTVHLTQPHLIDQVLSDLRLGGSDSKSPAAVKDTPMASSKILHKYPESASFDGHFDYRSVIGKLLYLEKLTRPDIAYAVHQCARFASDPKVEHGQAVKWLGRYLLGTKEQGMILKPSDQSFDCFVDADFCGNWKRDEAYDPATARSRSGFVIKYANCPIMWASKMQTEVALSTTEAEYVALSAALRECMPLMQLIKELQAHGFDMTEAKPKVHCRVFEDNSGALIMATEHKSRPRTKHLNVKYHHFRDHVVRKEISIHAIDTELQCADILTKPLNRELTERHRLEILGW
jgi:hypothetical protein